MRKSDISFVFRLFCPLAVFMYVYILILMLYYGVDCRLSVFQGAAVGVCVLRWASRLLSQIFRFSPAPEGKILSSISVWLIPGLRSVERSSVIPEVKVKSQCSDFSSSVFTSWYFQDRHRHERSREQRASNSVSIVSTDAAIFLLMIHAGSCKKVTFHRLKQNLILSC